MSITNLIDDSFPIWSNLSINSAEIAQNLVVAGNLTVSGSSNIGFASDLTINTTLTGALVSPYIYHITSVTLGSVKTKSIGL